MIKRHDVGTQASLVETFLLDFRLFGLSRIEGLLLRHAGFHRSLNAVGDVLHRHENVQFQIRRFRLFRLGLRVEAVLHVILLSARDFLKLAQSDMVVRDNQTSRTDKRTGPAIIEAHARQANVIEPLLGRREVVLFPQLFRRRIVECPHSLVGKDKTRAGQQDKQQDVQVKTDSHGHLLRNYFRGDYYSPPQLRRGGCAINRMLRSHR